LALITRAAEGSARDATSLLDQAISHGAGETGVDQVRAMLGLADRGRVMDLFEMILKGDAGRALAELSGQYAAGADPMAVLRDLAEIAHWISVVKISPEVAEDPTVPPAERLRGLDLAQRLPMRVLSRMWQMLLKAIEEVALAPNAMMAAEMAVIRLTHVADLPDPETLIRQLQGTPRPPAPSGGAPAGGGYSAGPGGPAMHAPAAPMRGPMMSGGAQPVVAEAPGLAFASFAQVVEFIQARRDMKLLTEIEDCVRLVKFAPGRIEFEPTAQAAPDLAARLSQRLQGWTGLRWGVSVVSQGGAPTIAETRDRDALAAQAEAMTSPMVMAVLAAFPGAKITAIRNPEDLVAEAAAQALPEVEDEWDPFEES
jgi:DNA polymerase-3 subunit gamma/tau